MYIYTPFSILVIMLSFRCCFFSVHLLFLSVLLFLMLIDISCANILLFYSDKQCRIYENKLVRVPFIEKSGFLSCTFLDQVHFTFFLYFMSKSGFKHVNFRLCFDRYQVK